MTLATTEKGRGEGLSADRSACVATGSLGSDCSSKRLARVIVVFGEAFSPYATSMFGNHAARGAFRDPQFLAALAAGPIVWGILTLLLPVAADPGWPASRPWFFLSIVLVYPFLEEVIFRGILQGWLLESERGRHRFGPVTVANAGAGVAFVLAHLINQPPSWALAVLVPALVFGYFRERHGLWSAVLLHVFYNFGFVWLFRF